MVLLIYIYLVSFYIGITICWRGPGLFDVDDGYVYIVKIYCIWCFVCLGLLTSEADTASHASVILKELVSLNVGERGLLIHDSQPFDDGLENKEASAIKSICATFENFLCTSDGKPNEHTLAVISTLFIKLGTLYIYNSKFMIRSQIKFYLKTFMFSPFLTQHCISLSFQPICHYVDVVNWPSDCFAINTVLSCLVSVY